MRCRYITLISIMLLAHAHDRHDASAYHHVAEIYAHNGKFEHALSCYIRALAADPHNSHLLFARARTHWMLEEYNHALLYFSQALKIDPDYAQARMWSARLLLMHGDFKRGWLAHESFITHTLTTNHTPITTSDDISGQTWAVECIGGFGDTFQFIRYAHYLHHRGVRIILRAPHALHAILFLCPYINQCIALSDELPAHDRYCALTSMPLICNTMSIDDIPRTIPYLSADPQLRTSWRHKIDPKALNIGICWHACQSNDNLQRFPSEHRSIPLQLLMPLAQLPNTKLYSLQKIDGLDEIDTINKGDLIACDDLDTRHGAFMDTAALICNLDLIITVDTALAHLAGALGAQTIVLLPYHADWRWLLHRTDSPWYPTMTLIRQKSIGDWQSVLDMLSYLAHTHHLEKRNRHEKNNSARTPGHSPHSCHSRSEKTISS